MEEIITVLKSKRKPGKLHVLGDSAEVLKYTLRAVKQENKFPKSYRWLLSQKIANEAVDAYACVKRANSVIVSNSDEYRYRHDQQIEAYAHYEALLGLIDTAYVVLDIDDHTIEVWTGLIVETENKLKRWRLSNDKEYSEFAN